MKILGYLESCQFYYIYQGVGTQHGGRAPQLRKLTMKINAYLLILGSAQTRCFQGYKISPVGGLDRVKLASSFLHCVAVAHKKSVTEATLINKEIND